MRAEIRRSVLGALMAVPLVLAQGTQPRAATVQTTGVIGVAKGISGLTFEGDTFDISFIHKPYAEAFPLGELFSTNLMSAIVVALNAHGVQSVSFSDTGVINKEFFVPVPFFMVSQIAATRSQCNTSTSPNTAGGAVSLCTWVDQGEFTNVDQAPWAVPVLVTTPLPSALPLFGTALGLLGFMGWRRRRKAAHNRF